MKLDAEYEKLAEYLPAIDKSFLDGIETALKDIDNFKWDYEYYLNHGDLREQLSAEIALEVLEKFKERLQGTYLDYKTSFIENNNYCIDENGNVMKEEE